MSTSKECKAVRNCILNELHLTKEDIIKNIEPLLEKHVKRYMVNTYGGDNQIENWIRCMVNDELKRRDHDFVRKACESVIRDHVLNELNIIVRSKSEKCTCENRVPSEEDKKESTDGLYIIYKDGHAEPFTGDNSKDCVRYIGLKHRYMSFAISLTEHDIVQLLDDDSREDFMAGAEWSINSAWYDASETPQHSGMLIAIKQDGTPIVCGPNNSNWKIAVRIFHIVRWAYIENLLPITC